MVNNLLRGVQREREEKSVPVGAAHRKALRLQRGVEVQSRGRPGEVQLHRPERGLARAGTWYVQLTRRSVNRIPTKDLAVILPVDSRPGLAPSAVCTVLQRPPATCPCTRAPNYSADVKRF